MERGFWSIFVLGLDSRAAHVSDICASLFAISPRDLTQNPNQAMCADKGMFDKMANTCARALELAGVKSEDLDGVEIVGGSSRIPALREKLADFFGKNVTQTLNSAESVARGASLACAMRSPAFKVREFKVADWNNKPIKVTYKTDDKKEVGEVDLEVGMEMPSTKKIALKTASGITLRSVQVQSSSVLDRVMVCTPQTFASASRIPRSRRIPKTLYPEE